MQTVCKLIPAGSIRRAGLVAGVLFAILFSLTLSVDRGLHSAFHRYGGAVAADQHHHHHHDSEPSGTEPCDSGSCAAGAFDKGLVDTTLLASLVEGLIGLIQPREFSAPSKPFVSLFVFLLPDRGPPAGLPSPLV